MKKAPVIIMIMSKDDMINYMNSKNAELTLYGCPSGSAYSNCHNS